MVAAHAQHPPRACALSQSAGASGSRVIPEVAGRARAGGAATFVISCGREHESGAVDPPVSLGGSGRGVRYAFVRAALAPRVGAGRDLLLLGFARPGMCSGRGLCEPGTQGRAGLFGGQPPSPRGGPFPADLPGLTPPPRERPGQPRSPCPWPVLEPAPRPARRARPRLRALRKQARPRRPPVEDPVACGCTWVAPGREPSRGIAEEVAGRPGRAGGPTPLWRRARGS